MSVGTKCKDCLWSDTSSRTCYGTKIFCSKYGTYVYPDEWHDC